MPPEAMENLVEPALLRKLERLAIAARRVQLGATKGERKSKRKGASVEFADYRDYVQGDDLRHIDWNIYGRLDTLYLKLFQEQEDLTVFLLLDGSRSMAFGTPNKFDFARRLAAAIGYVGLVGFDRVVAETLSTEGVRRLEPVRGKASARKLFAFLSSLEAGGGTDLEAQCRAFTLRNRPKGVVLLVSDFFDEEGFEGAVKHLAACGSDVYAVQVLAPEEISPSLMGDLKLVDSETQAFTEITVSRSLMKRYERNRDAFLERVRRFCHARGIGHFAVSSDTPIDYLTLDLMRKGGMFR